MSLRLSVTPHGARRAINPISSRFMSKEVDIPISYREVTVADNMIGIFMTYSRD